MLQNLFSTFLETIKFSSVSRTLNLKNSLKLSFSGFGCIKKRFLMVKSCLEHISKLILIGKSLANYLYMQIQGCNFLKSALNLDLTRSIARCSGTFFDQHLFHGCWCFPRRVTAPANPRMSLFEKCIKS